ncbi:hypothetical protein Salat_2025400 [Sesamum alatum]|uniref:Nucleolus and neural progenitor protein-like N-terminal domain-containing protein n=1 Tax=Sesamum alatum TaxID=300844 RepID=A0AAE1XZZ8_9LAMI|nr:hypothetical protein Salat_2025400 [Sesamum alatum]
MVITFFVNDAVPSPAVTVFDGMPMLQMGSEIETVEQRLKSFTGQLQTECGILERLVYKHKNQHRRCHYFQYILKVRRDLKLLKLANLEEIFDSCFLVVNGNRPKQKVQLLESLKRRKCGSGKYNFLERLLGVTRLLSEMVEPLLKAAMEISTLLARSFFMKFSLTIMAVLARIRVLVQQMLLDSVLLYNTVSSLSQREQTVKLNQEGFEVFREYYPKKEEATTLLECAWQTDKYVLVERMRESETDIEEKDDRGDFSLNPPNIQYQSIEVLLGVDEPGTTAAEDTVNPAENGGNSGVNNDEEHVPDGSNIAGASTATIVSSQGVFTNSPVGMIFEKESKRLVEDSSCMPTTPDWKSASAEAGLPTSSTPSPLSHPIKLKNEAKKKKVAFVSVKPPAASTKTESTSFHLKGAEKKGGDKEDDPFFNLLAGGNKNSSSLL